MSNKKVTNTTPFYFPPSSSNEGITMKHKIRTHVNNVHIYTTTMGILEMIVVCFSMRKKDIIEHTSGKCHVSKF
jgi:hypothetical protein